MTLTHVLILISILVGIAIVLAACSFIILQLGRMGRRLTEIQQRLASERPDDNFGGI